MDWCQTCCECKGYQYRNSAGEYITLCLCQCVPAGYERVPGSGFNCWTKEPVEDWT